MRKAPDLLGKIFLHSFNAGVLMLAVQANAFADGVTPAYPGDLPDTIVVKVERNADGTIGAIESVTPISTGGKIASDEMAQAAAAKAEEQEKSLKEECEEKIAEAVANYRRIARNTSRDDIQRVTLETVRTCNIPCSEKQQYGFTRYDSIARVHNPEDRNMAGKEACEDVVNAGAGTWNSRRSFGDYYVMGKGQYTNRNVPIYGISYNWYNPYALPFYTFTTAPYLWSMGAWNYMFFHPGVWFR